MNRPKVFFFAATTTLLVAGAVGFHSMQRNAEIRRQRKQKEEGSLPVTLATVETRPFSGSIGFTGTLLAVDRADLKAEVQGRVTRVTVQEGDRVSAGTVLCAQDEDELLLSIQAAEAQLAQAQVQAQQAKRDNDRAQSLLDKHSVTRQSAQQAETTYSAAMAVVRAAESNLGLAKSHLKKARIPAPFFGEIAQRLIHPGEMLSPGQIAFTVVDNRKLEIQADLPAEVLADIKVGLKATFNVGGFKTPFTATLTQISGSVQQDGRTLRVRLEVPNTDGRLKSGLFASGHIRIGGETTCTALPAFILTAIGRDADVFIAQNGVARRQKVLLLGQEENGWRAVSGLAVGTQIVAQGRNLVTEGTRIQVVPTSAPDPKGR